jgi:hypothetical protein
MTDFDVDEPVQPPRKAGRKRFWTIDRIIGWSGAALAMTAAFFPWYVFFNEDKFGVQVAIHDVTRQLPDRAGRPIVNPMPAAIASSNENLSVPAVGEQLITGAIPNMRDELGNKGDAGAMDQPFPGQTAPFKILKISNGKAMVEDQSGVYLVERGSSLPDMSKVASLEERAGKWVVVTDKGGIYSVTQN